MEGFSGPVTYSYHMQYSAAQLLYFPVTFQDEAKILKTTINYNQIIHTQCQNICVIKKAVYKYSVKKQRLAED